ncbi:ABC transporter substrate-binding protein [Halorubrum sp. AD140]|uniref:ABC transporter substrate-binding protein n=1 Tax=Halorubrum sp. AD140 TaxID=3050073 RepID=UPI002ACCEFE0|nr:ABC transporter substrate-binding protein [Halorubrum sp. AD140]MDZ5812815.1 ABC transporter substrate-binding protein [Halorubrum sp. AD140]
MSRDDTAQGAPTRREAIKYGGAVVGGGLLAGCTGEAEQDSGDDEGSTDDESYGVELSPVGEVEFDEVPETAASDLGIWADTLASFGQADRLINLRSPDTKVTSHFDQLPGVEFDLEGVSDFDPAEKELYYEVDPDVFHVDPIFRKMWNDWDDSDIDEVTENVAPFFANEGSRIATDEYVEDREYEFYSIEELTQKFGEVYDAEQQADALVDVRTELIEEIQSNLPPEDERPTVGRVLFYEGDINPYQFNGPGFGKAHQHPLEAVDVFADEDVVYEREAGSIDLEGLLEYDPDVLIFFDGIGFWFDDYAETKDELEDDPVGRDLTAIQNDRFYRGGTFDQGIALNLFQLEMTAKQLYPDQFGEWPGFDEQRVLPEIPEDERLFDRQRVADIINGDI